MDSRPQKGDTVRARIKCFLPNETPIDDHEVITFTVGDGEVIPGLEMVVALMDKDELSQVTYSYL